jgi:hypothetical protein
MIPVSFPALAGRMPAPSVGKASAFSTGTALYHKNANGINGVLLAEMQFVNSFWVL